MPVEVYNFMGFMNTDVFSGVQPSIYHNFLHNWLIFKLFVQLFSFFYNDVCKEEKLLRPYAPTWAPMQPLEASMRQCGDYLQQGRGAKRKVPQKLYLHFYWHLTLKTQFTAIFL